MTGMNLRGPRAIALAAVAAVSSLALLAERVGAQTVAGTAYGTYVNALGVTAQSPVATLPSTGGMSVGDAETFGVPSAIDARWLTAVTTGAADSPVSSSQSTSELENVSVLSGLITADVVTAIASSYRNASGAASDAAGSGFANLVVNGVAVSTDVAPNTRVDLPGVGYAVLNEQESSGDGVSSSGIKLNMIHVYLQSVTGGGCTLLGCVPGVLTTTGEIIVGSANSRVN
jgi:hypothetical protein